MRVPRYARPSRAAESHGTTRRRSVGCPQDAADVLRAHMTTTEQEQFMVISVDIRNQMIACETIALGSVAGVEVHPRDVFRAAIRANAAGIVLGHNHPSGDPSPSSEDIALTERLREAGTLIGIPVLDHLIVAGWRHHSLSESRP